MDTRSCNRPQPRPGLLGACALVGTLSAALIGAPAQAAPAPASPTASAAAACPELLQREFPRLQDEKPQALCQYSGKVLLVVNTASFCGNTPQYTDLEKMYEQYREKGFEILAFPANNFGQQEPGTNAEIKTFCYTKYSLSFPLFSKISVKGKS